jgi:hypothetical protein
MTPYAPTLVPGLFRTEQILTSRLATSAAVIASVVCAHTLAAPPAKSLPVISTFIGEGAADTLHTIQSDGLGPYRHTVTKGSTGVESHIQGSGGWELDMYYFTSNRQLYFDLRTWSKPPVLRTRRPTLLWSRRDG